MISTGLGEFSYDTIAIEDWEQTWVSVKQRTHIMLGIRACQNVQILLGTLIFNTDHLTNYLITLDRNGNQSTIEYVKYY